MAGYDNIKDKGFDKRTAEELRVITSEAGKASGKARRRKADFRKTLNALLTAKIDSPEWTPVLEALGLESTLEAALNMAMIKEGLAGNVKAYEAVAKYSGQTAKTDEDLKEQEVKITHIMAQSEVLKEDSEELKIAHYAGIPSVLIAPVFARVLFDIQDHGHTEYVFPGGRGSTKSSFVSLEAVNLIMQNDRMHAVVMRQVADTLRSSVYQQLLWAIEALGLSEEFHATVSPMEITRKSTGQKIYFRGADDPGKVKSIKVPFGYIGILWLEELDQFTGPESVRKIEQSVIRGGDVAYIFKSFNPPKSASNWANKYIRTPKDTRLTVESTYLDVPAKWLGKPFLEEAEFLKEVNPDAYENEYLGVANGTGGQVFEYLELREITEEELQGFDRIYEGVDWGYYPDYYAFVRLYYNAAQEKLYLLDEHCVNKASNRETAQWIIDKGYVENVQYGIMCDSSENKSVADYRDLGIWNALSVKKGPGSVEYSMKWLQRRKIVIDAKRTPRAYQEFTEYEYERDKDGNVISGYPDADNHCIDAVRYATSGLWKRRDSQA